MSWKGLTRWLGHIRAQRRQSDKPLQIHMAMWESRTTNLRKHCWKQCIKAYMYVNMNAKSICTPLKNPWKLSRHKLQWSIAVKCKPCFGKHMENTERPCLINHEKVPLMNDQRPASLARQSLWCMDPSKPWILPKNLPASHCFPNLIPLQKSIEECIYIYMYCIYYLYYILYTVICNMYIYMHTTYVHKLLWGIPVFLTSRIPNYEAKPHLLIWTDELPYWTSVQFLYWIVVPNPSESG